MTKAERLKGCLWGTAVGDALGLCREGLSARRGQRLYPRIDRYQLFAGRGMISDDTDHACFTAWALQQPEQFASRLRYALKRWLWTLPAAVGLATLRAGIRAHLGLARPGVYSAGNGPLMRAPVLATAAWEKLDPLLLQSSQLTHTDPRAHQGAMVVAAITGYLQGYCSWEEVLSRVEDPVLLGHLQSFGPEPTLEPQEWVKSQGWKNGVSGFVYHTGPLVALVALRYRDDYRQALRSTIECGGDTDTTAAIVGGMLGARLGAEAIPLEWRQTFADWPTTLDYLAKLAQGEVKHLPNFPGLVLRNLAFGGAVLGYGLRRLLPPY